MQGAAVDGNPFAQPGQTVPDAGAEVRGGRGGVGTGFGTRVGDLDAQLVRCVHDDDRGAGPRRVLDRVRQRLLRDPVRGQTDALRDRSGTDVNGYVARLSSALQPYGVAVFSDQAVGHSGTLTALTALTGLLTLMLVLVAGLGVLNTVVLDTRDRAHDIGVYKALGMTPRQTVGMVLSSVLLVGLGGGVLGVPVGYGLHATLAPAMGRAAGLTLPVQALDVYRPAELAALVVAGLVIAVLGALLPAGWAARTRTASAIRAE